MPVTRKKRPTMAMKPTKVPANRAAVQSMEGSLSWFIDEMAPNTKQTPNIIKMSPSKKVVQDDSKSVSPLTHRNSFSNPLSKHAIPIMVTLPPNPFLGVF